MNRIKSIALAENTYGYLLGMVLISIPFPYAYSSIALILLLAFSLIHALYRPKVFRFGYAIPVSLFLLMAMSLIWSVDTHKSIRGLERQLPFVLVPLAFWMMPKVTKEQMNKALSLFAYWVALFGSVLMIRSIFRSVKGLGSWVFSYHSLVDLFELNAIYISVMASLSLLFLLFYKKKNLITILAVSLIALFLVLLSSKNVIAVTLVCIAIGVLHRNKIHFKRWWGIGIAAIAIGGFLYFGPLKNRWNAEFSSNIEEVLSCEGFTDIYPWTGTSLRVFQARVFFELMQEENRWLEGFGINAVQDRIASKHEDYFLYCGYYTYNFHNQYIQTFAELGIFGFLLLASLLLVLFRLYANNKEPFILFVLLVMGFVFLTETYIWRQRGMFHFLIIYGMLVSMYPLRKSVKIAP